MILIVTPVVFAAFSFVRSHHTLARGRKIEFASDLAYSDSCLGDFCSSMGSALIASACRVAANGVPAACGVQSTTRPTRSDPTEPDPPARTGRTVFVL